MIGCIMFVVIGRCRRQWYGRTGYGSMGGGGRRLGCSVDSTICRSITVNVRVVGLIDMMMSFECLSTVNGG